MNDRLTNSQLAVLLDLIRKARADADKTYAGHQTDVGIFFNENYDTLAAARNWLEYELSLRA